MKNETESGGGRTKTRSQSRKYCLISHVGLKNKALWAEMYAQELKAQTEPNKKKTKSSKW